MDNNFRAQVLSVSIEMLEPTVNTNNFQFTMM